MTLVVDIGNTRLKWALADGVSLSARGETAYRKEGVWEALDERWRRLSAPPQVLACNVAGTAVAEALTTWVARYWRCEVTFVRARAVGWGVTSAYDDAGSLGADRWAALIAAQRKFSPPVCVVDCGTAITIDVLAAGGQHLGGLIIPGLTLMRRSLSKNTDGIREVVSGRVSLLARNTNDGVTAGTLYAAVAVIDRVVTDVEAALQEAVVCVLSGGDAKLLASLLARGAVCEPDLVLQGLAVMADSPA